MKPEAHRRLEDSGELQRPVMIMTGLWRRGYLRAPDLRDRRRDIRIPTDEPAQLTASGGSQRIEARILDVSRSGMRIGVDSRLPAGSIVTVHLRGSDVKAEVRYCRWEGDRYHAGLQVQTVV
jgi:hypothetical protein